MITDLFGRRAHLLWQAPGTNGTECVYMAQDRQGGWSQPTNLSQ